VDEELIHEASLVGEGATRSQVVKDAVDRLTSIGGVVHSVNSTEGCLALSFTHDALTGLKALHELVVLHGLKSISLKENLRRVTIQGKDTEAIRVRLFEQQKQGGIYRFELNQTGLVLNVEEKALASLLSVFNSSVLS
jgi:hypothetical protein